jgi:hypothetical protein
MSRGKHTRCSQCGLRGEYRYLELMWRLGLRGPWHYVGGYMCAADRRAVIGFIEQVSAESLVYD